MRHVSVYLKATKTTFRDVTPYSLEISTAFSHKITFLNYHCKLNHGSPETSVRLNQVTLLYISQTVRYDHSNHLQKLKYTLATQKTAWRRRWRMKVPGLLRHRLYPLRVFLLISTEPAGKCCSSLWNCSIVTFWRVIGISLLLNQ